MDATTATYETVLCTKRLPERTDCGKTGQGSHEAYADDPDPLQASFAKRVVVNICRFVKVGS